MFKFLIGEPDWCFPMTDNVDNELEKDMLPGELE